MLWQDKLNPPSPTQALAPDWFRQAKAAGASPEMLRAQVADYCAALRPNAESTDIWIDLMMLLYEEATQHE